MEKEELIAAIEKCTDNYQHRTTKQEVGKYLNCSGENVRHYANKYNLNDKDCWRNLSKNFIHLFDDKTALSSYWLGYLQADGCADEKRLILECNYQDKILLEEFCKDANLCTDRISERVRLDAGKENHSVRLDLARSAFNTFPDISKRKTYLDEHLPTNVDFWPYFEGLFHGDGCFGTSSGGHQIMVLVRDPMCSEMIDFLEKQLPYPTSIWKNHIRQPIIYTI